jgi:hypothetical protein
MDATKYKPTVNWRTWVTNVALNTPATDPDPATFYALVNPIDSNELGANEPILEGYLLIDYVGHIYPVTGVEGFNLVVSDVFRTNECPQNCQQGVVVKPVWNGRALYVSPVILSHLHHSAKSYMDSLNFDLLWSNDPNPRRIAFTDVLQPTIADYRADITCMDGTVINPERDYGQNPRMEIWQQVEANQFAKLQIEPFITRSLTDGFIDSILWSSTGEELTGYILISR